MNENNIHHKCKECGKPLSNPVSQRIGLGAVCRVKLKIEQAGEASQWLFADRSEYTYSFIGETLCIEDRLGQKSLTNDMRQVLIEITEAGVDIKGKTIIYKDSMGIWDGILAVVTPAKKIEIAEGVFRTKVAQAVFTIYPLTETEIDKAIAKAKNYKPSSGAEESDE